MKKKYRPLTWLSCGNHGCNIPANLTGYCPWCSRKLPAAERDELTRINKEKLARGEKLQHRDPEQRR